MNMPYYIDVHVLEGESLHGKIKKTVKLPAMLRPDGREVIFPPRYPNGLHPGVYGGGSPIIKSSDMFPCRSESGNRQECVTSQPLNQTPIS